MYLSIYLSIYLSLGVVFFFKICLFYVYEYTVAIFRHTRRGHQIPLQMVVSHHVIAGIELRTSGRAVLLHTS